MRVCYECMESTTGRCWKHATAHFPVATTATTTAGVRCTYTYDRPPEENAAFAQVDVVFEARPIWFPGITP